MSSLHYFLLMVLLKHIPTIKKLTLRQYQATPDTVIFFTASSRRHQEASYSATAMPCMLGYVASVVLTETHLVTYFSEHALTIKWHTTVFS